MEMQNDRASSCTVPQAFISGNGRILKFDTIDCALTCDASFSKSREYYNSSGAIMYPNDYNTGRNGGWVINACRRSKLPSYYRYFQFLKLNVGSVDCFVKFFISNLISVILFLLTSTIHLRISNTLSLGITTLSEEHATNVQTCVIEH